MWDTDKLVIAYTADTIGYWLNTIKASTIVISGPISVLISFQYKDELSLHKANGLNYLREIVPTLVATKTIKNTQQIYSIHFEKKLASKQEVNILICKAA